METQALYPPAGRCPLREPAKRDLTAMVLYRHSGVAPFSRGKRGQARWTGVERRLLDHPSDHVCISEIVEEGSGSASLDLDDRPGFLELVYLSLFRPYGGVAIEVSRLDDPGNELLTQAELALTIERLVQLGRTVRVYRGRGQPVVHPRLSGPASPQAERLQSKAWDWGLATYGATHPSEVFGHLVSSDRDLVHARAACERLMEQGFGQSAMVQYLRTYGFTNRAGHIGSWSPALVRTLLEAGRE